MNGKTLDAPAPQTRLLGPGSLRELGSLITRLDPKTAMLVTGGSGYVRSGVRDVVEPAIAGLDVTRFGGTGPNPGIADVEHGLDLWRRARPALIIAVGGGSVLDTGKLIGLLAPGTASWRDFLDGQGGSQPRAVPVIAIPTTAGSGAEATRFAAFYVSGRKHSISHALLRPSHAIVDSLLTASVPPEIAAAAALDALAQAIESFWAVGATEQSQILAEAALGEILPCLAHLGRASTPRLRERMALGANLAGRAIDLSRTTAAHALSYALTADLGVSHGHAVALVLPAIFRINADPGCRRVQEPRGAAYLAGIMDRITRLLFCRDAEDAACFLSRAVLSLGLAGRLAPARSGVTPVSLAAKVDAERMGNNPVSVSAADAREIYGRLMAQGSAA